MEANKIYYKISKESELGLKIKNLITTGQQSAKEIEAYVQELGATNYLVNDRYLLNTGISAVEFVDEPDMKIWKKFDTRKFPDYYAPRLGSKKGKEIQTKFDLFKKVKREEIDLLIGNVSFCRSCGIALGGTDFYGIVIEDDWELKMPSDCIEVTFTEYKKLFIDV